MSNVEIAQKGYKYFAEGNIAGLLEEVVDPACEWLIAGDPRVLPYAGRFRGKEEIAGFFQRLVTTVNYTKFEPTDFIDGGDTVTVIGEAVGTFKSTGKTASDRWVHIARYRDGKLVFFESYNDTAAAEKAAR
jgi:uncharacterized protein